MADTHTKIDPRTCRLKVGPYILDPKEYPPGVDLRAAARTLGARISGMVAVLQETPSGRWVMVEDLTPPRRKSNVSGS